MPKTDFPNCFGIKYTPAIQFIQSIPSTWKGHELFAIWVVKMLKPKIVVDLGFDMGLSTIALAHRNRGHTFGIDWVKQDFSRKKASLDSAFQNISAAIRMKYVKNIHLIVGPIEEISQNWNREIGLLHIDCTQSYQEIKIHYENWSQFLKEDGVILIHNIEAYPNEVGRFFRELDTPKLLFPQGKGLGIATKNREIYEKTLREWKINPPS